jgi:hypothetical protein
MLGVEVQANHAALFSKRFGKKRSLFDESCEMCDV